MFIDFHELEVVAILYVNHRQRYASLICCLFCSSTNPIAVSRYRLCRPAVAEKSMKGE